MTELNDRICRAITLSTQVITTSEAATKAVSQHIATERDFTEAWNALTPEEQRAINEVTP